MADPPKVAKHLLPGGRIGREVREEGPDGGPALHLHVPDRELDRLREQRWLSQFQYDAGNKLRDLWEDAGIRSSVHAMNVDSFVGIFEGPRGEVSNAEAFAKFQRYLQDAHPRCIGVIFAACIQDVSVTDYAARIKQHFDSAMQDLQRGLGKIANTMRHEIGYERPTVPKTRDLKTKDGHQVWAWDEDNTATHYSCAAAHGKYRAAFTHVVLRTTNNRASADREGLAALDERITLWKADLGRLANVMSKELRE